MLLSEIDTVDGLFETEPPSVTHAATEPLVTEDVLPSLTALDGEATIAEEAVVDAATVTAQIAGRVIEEVTRGDFAFTKHLLESNNAAGLAAVLGAQDEQGRTALHWAALCGEEAVTRQLLAKAGDREYVERRAKDTQQTALHWAVVKNNLGVMWQLRRAGAEMRARDSLGASAAVLAVQHGNLEALLLLLHWDASIGEVADINGCTAVHWAAYKNDLNALRVLHFAQGGAGFDAVDRQGMTAVHRAVNYSTCVQFLVTEGLVDPQLSNQQGQKASELARNAGHERVARYLDQFDDKQQQYVQVATSSDPISNLQRKVKRMQSEERLKNLILPLVYWIFAAAIIYTYSFVLKSSSIVFVLFGAPALGSYLWLMLGDPGHRKRRLKGSSAVEQFQQMLERRAAGQVDGTELELTELCLTCRDWKSLRTKHCAKCNKCCDGFDHCCPWINNDVASKNHRLFILMLLFNTTALTAFFVCLIAELPGDEFFVIRMFLSAVTEPALFGLVVLTCFFLPFVSIMLVTQLRIVGTNMNTNELLNMHRYSHFWRPSSPSAASSSTEQGLAAAQGDLMMNHLQAVAFVNPFDKGVMKNCIHFWTADENFSGLAISVPKRLGNFQIKRVFDSCCDTNHSHAGDIELGGLAPRQ